MSPVPVTLAVNRSALVDTFMPEPAVRLSSAAAPDPATEIWPNGVLMLRPAEMVRAALVACTNAPSTMSPAVLVNVSELPAGATSVVNVVILPVDWRSILPLTPSEPGRMVRSPVFRMVSD